MFLPDTNIREIYANSYHLLLNTCTGNGECAISCFDEKFSILEGLTSLACLSYNRSIEVIDASCLIAIDYIKDEVQLFTCIRECEA